MLTKAIIQVKVCLSALVCVESPFSFLAITESNCKVTMDVSIPPFENEASETIQPTIQYQDIGTLQKTLAPVTSADLFKSQEMMNKPRASIEVHNFLSHEARLRQPSSLKAGTAGLPPNIISLSTGRPSPDTYPFHGMDFSFIEPRISATPATERGATLKSCSPGFQTRKATITRRDPAAAIDLSIALSYGYSLGHEQLIQFLTSHISHVHSPPYSDWEVCLTVGNTSALEIALRNFANSGDSVLVEENTYSGATEMAKPLGITMVPIHMDHHGLCPGSLDRTLSSWAVNYPEKPKPRILYTIPTGQNPTGITQPLERRVAILEVAEHHNLLLIEDDPYYFLQFPQSDKPYFSTVLPSYLALCKTGRVIRLDSTSKILAPGLRLGWLTAPRAVVETYQASHDLGVVHPSGLSQVVTFKLLSEIWGHGGFEEWLGNLAELYRQKALVTLRACQQFLGTGSLGEICSWTTIEAGMFIWLRIKCDCHLRASDRFQSSKSEEIVRLEIEDEIYTKALKNGVLCCKGSYFRVFLPPPSMGFQGLKSRASHDGEWEDFSIYFRLTFASVDEEELMKGIKALAEAIKKVLDL